MKTSAYLPVGGTQIKETKLIQKGDLLELQTGEKVIFLEMKRVNFIAKDQVTGKNFVIPTYRNKHQGLPYIKAVVGKDKSVITKSAPVSKFKYGQLFALEGKKQAFMFVGNTVKRGTNRIVGVDIATGHQFTIGEGFTIVKINIPKLKREHPATS